MVEAASPQALEADPEVGKYALPNGLPELRELATVVHARKTGITVDAEQNVFVTAGNMQGMSSILRTLLEPGDEVIVTDPGFASHLQQIRMRGAKPVYWPLDEATGWRLQVKRLAELVTPRTKVVVRVSPCNPTGTIFSEPDLLQLGEVVLEHGLVLLIDDPYSEITYDESPVYNLACRPELAEHLAYLFTFSKIHAMSGWRLGYAILPDWLRRQVLKVHDATMICAPRVSQVAGIAALSGSDDHMHEFRAILARRRELICERLDRVDHVLQYVKPEGAYYVFPRLVVDHQNARDFAIDLLNETRVAVTPGSAFGPGGEHHVRMAFCVEDATIETAFDRIERRFGA
jgi:aspartate/methionine/tyrosine aminotransferase